MRLISCRVRQNFMQRVVQHLFPDDTVVKNCRTSGLVSENGMRAREERSGRWKVRWGRGRVRNI